MLAELLLRCTFPAPGTRLTCGFSGGADSTALVVLAAAGGCDVRAVYVDHGLRPSSKDEAAAALALAERVGVPCEVVSVDVAAGPNLEERARLARLDALGPDAALGHTADDRAETMLVNLLRGAGAAGLSAMGPAPTRPLLALRRRETAALCREQGLTPVHDPTNDDPRFVRNRVRQEVLPLLDDVAGRDVVELLVRTADVLAADLEAQRAALAPWVTDDARVIAALPVALARGVVRQWLIGAGQRPDRAAVERVLAVARGGAAGCELAGGVRVERHRQRLRIGPGPGVS